MIVSARSNASTAGNDNVGTGAGTEAPCFTAKFAHASLLNILESGSCALTVTVFRKKSFINGGLISTRIFACSW